MGRWLISWCICFRNGNRVVTIVPNETDAANAPSFLSTYPLLFCSLLPTSWRQPLRRTPQRIGFALTDCLPQWFCHSIRVSVISTPWRNFWQFALIFLCFTSLHFRIKELWTPLLRTTWFDIFLMLHCPFSCSPLYSYSIAWWSLCVECSLTG